MGGARRCGSLALVVTMMGGVTMVRAEEKTLREAAGGRMLVGTALMSNSLDDAKVAGVVGKQFSCITPENEMKPASVQVGPGKFDFSGGDKIVEFAKAHDMKVVGHTLCWHNQSPAWLFMDENRKPLPREKALENLKAHIEAVAGHFKGQVVGWDVVNEAISDAGGEYLRDTPARRAIGDDYIQKAFEFAHAADPGAELYYNDYSNENREKREKTIRLIRSLKDAGCKVDGVGLQGHFMMRYASTTPRILDEAIGEYAKLGVKVMITELDVDVLPRKGAGADVTATEQGGIDPYQEGLPAEVAKGQAKFYSEIFEAINRHPGVVTRVTFWGVNDGMSWLNSWPVRGRTNHALLWDRAWGEKAAFGAVVKGLEGGR